MKKPKKRNWFRYLLYTLAGIVGIFIILAVYLVCVALIHPPKPKDLSVLKLERKKIDANCYTIGQNWIRKSECGLWELYIEGDAFERGVVNGKLAKELVQYQEKTFSDQITKIIPSDFYRGFLKYFIAWFNRDLDKNMSEEEKLEIYGVSESASHEFDYIGSPYQRILNYHAAHDIGHALQNMALVGCSSFATWNGRSQDSLLIAGRNFDFYVGDQFAENKIVQFTSPTKGYKFMMITWGGMTGVVSGMNLQGLSITLNSDKSEVPSGSATPVSILAREILQYAKNINEAVEIARKKKTFVSESFLVASAADNKAVVIEKSPRMLDIYETNNNEIVCTNHYQGKELTGTEVNKKQMDESASVYRHKRLEELLSMTPKNTVENTVAILRDKAGLGGKFIGLGNEKAVNQLICHHSIVFEPQKRLVWVSTAPWQLGKYVAYDLNKIFAMHGLQNNNEIYESSLTVPADSFLLSEGYQQFFTFRRIKDDYNNGKDIDINALVKSNPEFYHTYMIAGDYLFKRKQYKEAVEYYKTALTKEIATKHEENHIRKQMDICLKKSSS